MWFLYTITLRLWIKTKKNLDRHIIVPYSSCIEGQICVHWRICRCSICTLYTAVIQQNVRLKNFQHVFTTYAGFSRRTFLLRRRPPPRHCNITDMVRYDHVTACVRMFKKTHSCRVLRSIFTLLRRSQSRWITVHFGGRRSAAADVDELRRIPVCRRHRRRRGCWRQRRRVRQSIDRVTSTELMLVLAVTVVVLMATARLVLLLLLLRRLVMSMSAGVPVAVRVARGRPVADALRVERCDFDGIAVDRHRRLGRGDVRDRIAVDGTARGLVAEVGAQGTDQRRVASTADGLLAVLVLLRRRLALAVPIRWRPAERREGARAAGSAVRRRRRHGRHRRWKNDLGASVEVDDGRRRFDGQIVVEVRGGGCGGGSHQLRVAERHRQLGDRFVVGRSSGAPGCSSGNFHDDLTISQANKGERNFDTYKKKLDCPAPGDACARSWNAHSAGPDVRSRGRSRGLDSISPPNLGFSGWSNPILVTYIENWRFCRIHVKWTSNLFSVTTITPKF